MSAIKALSRFAGIAVPAIMAFAVLPAGATDGGSWQPFKDTTGATGQVYDASFAKQWEANPPKGFPTLSADNLRRARQMCEAYDENAEACARAA